MPGQLGAKQGLKSTALGAFYETCPVADDLEWQLKGLCASGRYDPDLWAPQGFDEPVQVRNKRHSKAKQICHGCPVLTSCATWALNSGERHGVWGGLGESDRLQLWGKARRRRGNSQESPRLHVVSEPCREDL